MITKKNNRKKRTAKNMMKKNMKTYNKIRKK